MRKLLAVVGVMAMSVSAMASNQVIEELESSAMMVKTFLNESADEAKEPGFCFKVGAAYLAVDQIRALTLNMKEQGYEVSEISKLSDTLTKKYNVAADYCLGHGKLDAVPAAVFAAVDAAKKIEALSVGIKK